MTKQELIDFEKEVARLYEAGEIKSPVHLSGGSEEQLIEIFADIQRTDIVLSTWRNHYHALLHGIPPDELMRQILDNRSMCVNSVEPWFYTSSIAGGILPIAVGLGMAIKRKCQQLRSIAEPVGPLHAAWDEIMELERQHVWCFVGEMVAEMGIFYESRKYARNWNLPVTFIVEDNGKSVQTVTQDVWGGTDMTHPTSAWDNVKRYEYELTWPHHGSGTFVQLPF